MPRSPTGWARHSRACPEPPRPSRPARAAPPEPPAPGLLLSLVLMRPVIPERPTVYQSVQRSWLIWAMRLIRCTIDPLINHEARINHIDLANSRTGERIM